MKRKTTRETSPKPKRTRIAPDVDPDPVPPTTSKDGPTMDQFKSLMNSVEELKAMFAAHVQKRDDDESEPEAPDAVAEGLFHDGMTYEEKYNTVTSLMPINSNAVFRAIVQDVDGSKCLLWTLQLSLNKAVAEEGATYDTTSNSSAIASKVLHVLFTIDYVKKFRVYDPRDNYVQQVGTAMPQEVYEWLKDSLSIITEEFYNNFQMQNRFNWDEFYVKFRNVWRWTRSNNSDNRRARRRQKKN